MTSSRIYLNSGHGIDQGRVKIDLRSDIQELSKLLARLIQGRGGVHPDVTGVEKNKAVTL
jgi:hypothetical protein